MSLGGQGADLRSSVGRERWGGRERDAGSGPHLGGPRGAPPCSLRAHRVSRAEMGGVGAAGWGRGTGGRGRGGWQTPLCSRLGQLGASRCPPPPGTRPNALCPRCSSPEKEKKALPGLPSPRRGSPRFARFGACARARGQAACFRPSPRRGPASPPPHPQRGRVRLRCCGLDRPPFPHARDRGLGKGRRDVLHYNISISRN